MANRGGEATIGNDPHEDQRTLVTRGTLIGMVVALASTTGCAVTMSDRAAFVRGADLATVSACEVVGPVGDAKAFFTSGEAGRNHRVTTLEEAGVRGATHVVWTPKKVSGTAYRCPVSDDETAGLRDGLRDGDLQSSWGDVAGDCAVSGAASCLTLGCLAPSFGQLAHSYGPSASRIATLRASGRTEPYLAAYDHTYRIADERTRIQRDEKVSLWALLGELLLIVPVMAILSAH